MSLKPTVVSIQGHARSGSTILDILLGQSYDVVSTGELCNFYRFAYIEPQYCSCGTLAKDCDFWAPVSAEMASRLGHEDFIRLARRQSNFERHRYLPKHLIRPRRRDPDETAYLEQTVALYQSVLEVSGRQIVVDSSKRPIRLFWLRQLAEAGEIDLKVISIIRDGRGVAWSLKPAWVKDPKVGKQVNYRGRSTLHTSFTWVFNGIENEIVTRGMTSETCRVVRYEDLCADPVRIMEQLARFLGVSPDPMIASVLYPERGLRKGHLVAGNRMRMAKSLKFQPDVEWMEKMPKSERLVFWLLAGWYARRRGYSADGLRLSGDA